MARDILFLAFPDFQLLDLTGPLQMFASANDELGSAAYVLSLAAPERVALRSSSGLAVVADLAFADLADARLDGCDSLIAVGGDKGVRRALKEGAVAAILARAPGRVRRIASVCSGAFFLAAAGLLDGRRATTHWDSVARLRAFRPAVTVEPDAIHVRDDPYWTSAGVTAGIDLALAMIEADHGRALALAVARRNLVFAIRPGGQSQFSAELMSDAGDERIAALAKAVLAQPAADWRVEALADAAGMSPRSLSRAFRRVLKQSPADYVERLRVDIARRALLETPAAIGTIAQRCGFGSLRRMDRAFARTIAASPRDFRQRFQMPETHDGTHDRLPAFP